MPSDHPTHRLIKESGMAIYPYDLLDEAAAKAVEMAQV